MSSTYTVQNVLAEYKTFRLQNFLSLSGMLDVDNYFHSEFAEHSRVVAATRDQLVEPFKHLVETCVKAVRGDGKLMFFGNGGSARRPAPSDGAHRTLREESSANCCHLAEQDTSALTATGNDFSFDQLFARQVLALGKAGDVAIGISTSGRSANVVHALRVARKQGIVPAALTGRDGGDLIGLAEPILIVPSDTTSRIQEMHITLGQTLCGALELGLGLV